MVIYRQRAYTEDAQHKHTHTHLHTTLGGILIRTVYLIRFGNCRDFRTQSGNKLICWQLLPFILFLFLSLSFFCIKLLISWISTVLHFFSAICFSCYVLLSVVAFMKIDMGGKFWSNEKNASKLKNC